MDLVEVTEFFDYWRKGGPLDDNGTEIKQKQ
jgi:hypothetical protein